MGGGAASTGVELDAAEGVVEGRRRFEDRALELIRLRRHRARSFGGAISRSNSSSDRPEWTRANSRRMVGLPSEAISSAILSSADRGAKAGAMAASAAAVSTPAGAVASSSSVHATGGAPQAYAATRRIAARSPALTACASGWRPVVHEERLAPVAEPARDAGAPAGIAGDPFGEPPLGGPVHGPVLRIASIGHVPTRISVVG